MLVIIPTPIGNLRDISLRQYTAIHECDILATEDTRTTGKLINLLKRLRLTDPTISKLDSRASKESEEEKKVVNEEGDLVEQTSLKEEVPAVQSKELEVKSELTVEQEEKIKVAVLQYYANKSLEVPTLKVDKEDIKELLTSTYFRKVLDSEDYDNRKKVLEYCQPLIEKKMQEIAKNYDQERKLSLIMKRKPRYVKEEQKSKQEDQEPNYDEYQFLYGVDNEQVQEIRDHIARVKKKKGRGLLVSLNAENEKKRIPRLLKVMKLGFRVGLLSEAGTPTISDPGSEFVRIATNEGISVEALPGPCAAIVGLVASGLQHAGFIFHGFLPKGRGQKVKVLNRYYKLGLPVILYESFERIEPTIESIEEVYGEEHEVYLGAELTKMHERHYKGTIKKIREKLRQPEMSYKGELTVVIEGLGYERGADLFIDDGQVTIDAEELGRVLNDNIDLPDKDFKRIMRLVTGLNQVQIGAILRKIKPKKRMLDQFDDLIKEARDK
jgi:16S rRNA (cytidine1402-2'-O)-methyltransferase